jgi:hypothetical protein
MNPTVALRFSTTLPFHNQDQHYSQLCFYASNLEDIAFGSNEICQDDGRSMSLKDND